jgi:amphi-Trp domain-containing protein
MAETTTDETTVTRAEAASFLRRIADELDAGSGGVSVPVGNKEIRLSPPDRFDAETTITERSRRLRKDVEEVSITFRWNPTGETAAFESDSEPDSESDPGPGTENEPETGS